MSKIALGGLLLMAAAGAWLVAAPFAERYQAAGAPWTGAALMHVAVGAIVAAARWRVSSPRWPAAYASFTLGRPAAPRRNLTKRSRVLNP